MSAVGIFLLVIVCWMVLAAGGKLLALIVRAVPAGLLGLAALFCGVIFFGPGCDRDKSSTEVVFVDASAVARVPRPPEPPTADLPSATTIPVETPKPRPAWVEAPGKLVDSVYSVPVKSGLFSSVPESQRALDIETKREADHYINEYLGDADAATRVDISLDYLKKHVKRAEFSEIVESASVGPMHQIHALLEFNDQARGDFERKRKDSLVTERLEYVGWSGAAVLTTLAALYGYLKWSLRRRGAPRSGTRTALAAALIVALGALATRLTLSLTWQ